MAEQEQHGKLEQLWEEHIRHQFSTRNTDETLATMVDDAYVDHVPVLTGGSGQAELRQFYSTHFIPKMPPDMEMVPVSRTVGSEQLVDEVVIKFTHTIEMDWMLPGIPPTGRRAEVPLVVIVRFRHGGPVPKWRQPAVTHPSTVPQDRKRENDLREWMSHASGHVRQRWRTLFGHDYGGT